MMSLLRCSDEAFLRLVRACADHYREDGWEIMFDEATDEEVLEDRMEAIQCVVAYMESLYNEEIAVV